jgi:hypothetical protein
MYLIYKVETSKALEVGARQYLATDFYFYPIENFAYTQFRPKQVPLIVNMEDAENICDQRMTEHHGADWGTLSWPDLSCLYCTQEL